MSIELATSEVVPDVARAIRNAAPRRGATGGRGKVLHLLLLLRMKTDICVFLTLIR